MRCNLKCNDVSNVKRKTLWAFLMHHTCIWEFPQMKHTGSLRASLPQLLFNLVCLEPNILESWAEWHCRHGQSGIVLGVGGHDGSATEELGQAAVNLREICIYHVLSATEIPPHKDACTIVFNHSSVFFSFKNRNRSNPPIRIFKHLLISAYLPCKQSREYDKHQSLKLNSPWEFWDRNYSGKP